MKGHVRKRGGRWEVILEFGKQDAQRCPVCMARRGRQGGRLLWTEAGRHNVCPDCGGPLEDVQARRQIVLPDRYRTKEEADARLTREKFAGLEGTFTEPAKLIVQEHLDNWLATVRGNVASTTYVAYELHVRRIKAHIGRVRLQKLSAMDIDRLYARLRAEKTEGGRGPLSAATVKGVHRVLHHALATAVDWNLIPRNPADKAKNIKVRKREMTTWTAEQLAAFLQATADDRLNPLWRLLATTGLRRGEALGLKWSDFDPESRRLTIRRSRKQVGYAVVEENLKTDNPRSVPIDPGTVEALRRQAERQLEDETEWQGALTADDHVFTREDGKPWHPDRITKLFDEAVETAGVKRIRLHDLRHSHACLGLQAGIHPKVMSERLGHSSIAMTLDTYSHVIPTLQDSAADLIGAIVDTALEAHSGTHRSCA